MSLNSASYGGDPDFITSSPSQSITSIEDTSVAHWLERNRVKILVVAIAVIGLAICIAVPIIRRKAKMQNSVKARARTTIVFAPSDPELGIPKWASSDSDDWLLAAASRRTEELKSRSPSGSLDMARTSRKLSKFSGNMGGYLLSEDLSAPVEDLPIVTSAPAAFDNRRDWSQSLIPSKLRSSVTLDHHRPSSYSGNGGDKRVPSEPSSVHMFRTPLLQQASS